MDWETVKTGVQSAWEAMTYVEILAVGFGILYVVLAAVESIWCWLAALISVTLYVYICYAANLKAETGLQVFYWIMAVYGWYEWKFGSKKKKDELEITKWPIRYHFINIILSGATTVGLGFYLVKIESSNPFLDAFTTVFAIVATFMVARKILENWIYWIIIDAVSIYLYGSRGLYLTSGLFVAYTVIAILGYFSWLKIYKTQNA